MHLPPFTRFTHQSARVSVGLGDAPSTGVPRDDRRTNTNIIIVWASTASLLAEYHVTASGSGGGDAWTTDLATASAPAPLAV